MASTGAQSDSICYTLINVQTDNESINEINLKNDLEKGDIKAKTEALKKLIYMILNGEKFPPSLLMIIIRYILPCQDHQIKKLLLIFWEIVPKRGADGKLLHEMILVCDAYRKDLQHPNEYIRGSTLRFLCKLKEPELLEPLMASIRACVEHRHSYVRRNAVLAIFKIYINFEFLIPDAPELILDFLSRETDASCKRNAFLMLIHLDQVKALDYLNSCLDQITSFNHILQLVCVELIYKVCIANPSERSRFIRAIYNLLNTSTSTSVRYEAAATLITLSQAPTALKAAATCFIDICLTESDNNVKLIVLDRLVALKESASGAEKVLQEVIMDILRILNVASDLEVKQKVLNLALDLITLRNAEEMVHLLKKEINKTQNESILSNDETCKYRQLLVGTLHSICLKYPDVLVSDQLITVLFELLSAEDEVTAQMIIAFSREFITKNPQHKSLIITKILEAFQSVRSVKVHRGLIWLLGEFCEESDPSQIQETMTVIRNCLGEIPIVDSELKKLEEGQENEDQLITGFTALKLVTADGSYATQSALSVASTKTSDKSKIPPLRSYLLNGEYFIGTALANCLVKLALKFKQAKKDPKSTAVNSFVAECMLILTSILHVGRAKLSTNGTVSVINEDDYERVAMCLMILSHINSDSPSSEVSQLMKSVFLHEMRSALVSMLTSTKQEKEEVKEKKKDKRFVETDDHLNFSQLMSKNQEMFENQFELSLSQAMGANVGATATSSLSRASQISDLLSTSKLSKVTQLTGFSDPVYAECYVNVNQYDICLDVLIVNQTSDILQNCTLELSTLGDLKLVERPQPIVLAPHDFANIKATVKVASTENGIIFGNIVYDVSGSTSDRNVVVLNDIHIDIMDYIVPATCSDTQFRQMWAEFEWENKVTVNTALTDLQQYLTHLIKSTNMKCLTPQKALSGDCSFLAANLYAKSIFGEDALANVSIEKSSHDNPVTGHIRIRAKSQGMALSLGDKVNATQKTAKMA
ncbi:coatomer subunit beta-like protein [Dinothrombium tinctorium]|uniref:Coatomer subunit beta n=2 Tax=Dinothrombium tinctorium TaxID=1965070 RepID=A0A3S3NMP9_9ACAR|nr:coatomer subunit beta-like protein [Dinothrombium tinctorium]RWS05748.1 coatomer subunit beta-like protein [Dinothrombium tinctorium]